MEQKARPQLEKLNRGDLCLLALALSVLVGSLWVAGHYFHRAFPEASIDFRVSATSSQPVAERFAAAHALPLAGDRHAVEFAYDDEAKTFLERELGLERSEALLHTRVRLWRWEHRWFRPLTKEEVDIAVSAAGEVVGFNHAIADEAPGANLTPEEARARAEAFLTRDMGLDLSQLQPVGTDREQRAHRTDYTFTWKDSAPLEPDASGELAQAEYRRMVRIQGDEVGQYREWLRVPDQWQRDFARLRSRNETAGNVDSGLLLVVFVAMLIVLVMRLRMGDIRWRPALWVGGAGAVLSLLSAMNGLSQDFFNYDTTQSWAGFVSSEMVSAVLSALGVGVLLLALTATAESLYRERFGGQIALDNWLRAPGLRSKGFFLSLALGLALAAFFFAYQAVFYLIANHFGAWAPADVPYDDLLNTRLPWAFVLFSGFFPAISEEFGFRMLAIPLLEKWLRRLGRARLWAAVIAASFLWGFGHATYPNEPYWIRGVEVGLGGILLSWVMIRFGILTTVVWHYTVDALYTAMLLLRAHDAYLRFSGGFTALLAVVPLLAAGIGYLRRGGFEASDQLTNAAEGSAVGVAAAPHGSAEAGEEEEAEETPYEPVPGQAWTLGILVAVVLMAAWTVPLLSWASAMPWKTAPQQAVATARRFLDREGLKLDGYRAGLTAASPESLANGLGDENAVAAADIFHMRGRRALIAAFSGPAGLMASYYRVRFYRPLQEEEYTVAVRPDGGPVLGFARQIPDAAPGASPRLEQAEAIALGFLTEQGVQPAGLELRTATQERRPARTDSDLVWEKTEQSPLPGEVSYRVEVELAGDQVAMMHAWYYVPEARVRAYEKETLVTTLLTVFRYAMFAGLAGLLLWHILAFARSHQPWLPVVRLAILGGLVNLLAAANGLPAATAAQYDTAQPWSAWLVQAGVGLAAAALLGFLATLALLPPLAISFPRAWLLVSDPRHRDAWEDAWAWDALWVGVLALGWSFGWIRVGAVFAARWHAAATPPMYAPPDGLGNWIPGATALLSAPLHALWLAAFLGLLLPVLLRGWSLGGQRRWITLGGWGLLWLGVTAGSEIHGGAEFACAAVLAGGGVGLLWGFAHLFLRENPLAYLTAVLTPMLMLGAADWFDLRYPAAQAVGWIFVAATLGWMSWLARHAQRARQRAKMA